MVYMIYVYSVQTSNNKFYRTKLVSMGFTIILRLIVRQDVSKSVPVMTQKMVNYF